jgi:isopentenyl diphosphate isomerase/L-lactate dehydrogenase-like FMN-dependent dehydrogenase
MIFAREISDNLTSLVKKIDEATAKNSSCNMGSFVVFCSDDEALAMKLKDLAKKQGLKKVVLTIDNPAGPEGYDIAKNADITVVLYTDKKVKANRAFKKGELKAKDIDAIVADVAKIVPAKKE